jgi:dolichol-phosphate mannosyltransferase
MDTLVMIPTYNERDNIEALVAEVLKHERCGVLIIDDQSPDGTGAIADRLVQEHPGRVHVLHRAGPKGLGRSYVDGIRRALEMDVAFICQMDADFSHDPKYLAAIISAAAHGIDLVIGSRYVEGVSVVNWPLKRIILSTFANKYIRVVTGLQVRDCTAGYRCWGRDALRTITTERDIVSEGYAFQVEMLYEAARHRFRIAEVPIIFVERSQGASKVGSAGLTESFFTPWRLVLRGGRVKPARPS